jgi:hypothetical protein
MVAKEDSLYIARRASEVAAQLRTEDENSHAHKTRLETWEHEADRKEREAKSDTAASLAAYVRACGFSPEAERLMLVAMAATRGAGRPVTAPDWMMGVWLDGGTEEDVRRIEQLPAHSTEKRTLAQSWTRAWKPFDEEQRDLGFNAITRQQGTKNWRTGKNKASQLHAHFVQHLVEIEREARLRRGVRRFERFSRAARDVVERVRREHPRPKDFPSEPRRRRMKQPDTPALCCHRLLRKIREAAEDEIKRARATGAQPEDIHAMLESAFEELGGVFAIATPADTADTEPEQSSEPLLEDLDSIKRSSNLQTDVVTTGKSEAHFENAVCKNIKEICGTDAEMVVKIDDHAPVGTQPDYLAASTAVLDEKEFREQIAAMLERGALDEESAREFEQTAHDPIVRTAFCKRYKAHPLRELTADATRPDLAENLKE